LEGDEGTLPLADGGDAPATQTQTQTQSDDPSTTATTGDAATRPTDDMTTVKDESKEAGPPPASVTSESQSGNGSNDAKRNGDHEHAPVDEKEDNNNDDIKRQPSSTNGSSTTTPYDFATTSSGIKRKRLPLRGIRRALSILSLSAMASKDLDDFASKLGMPPRHLAYNLGAYKKYDPPPHDWEYETRASDMICDRMKTVDDVMREARHIAALKLVADPLLRKQIRRMYHDASYVNTKPTLRGLREVDWMHEYFSVIRIVDKPVHNMSGTDYILIDRAVKEGFITCTVGERSDQDRRRYGDDRTRLTQDIMDFYIGETPLGQLAKRWSDQRKLILREALHKKNGLFELAEQFIRVELLRKAREAVVDEASSRLRVLLTVAPYTAPHHQKDDDDKNEDEEDEDKALTIVSCVVGDQDAPSYFVALNARGELIDHLALHFLKTKTTGGARDAAPSAGEKTLLQRKRDDTTKLQDFIRKHKPPLILVDASSMESYHFKVDLAQNRLGEFRRLQVSLLTTPSSSLHFILSSYVLCHRLN
jgi:hypothetical protein